MVSSYEPETHVRFYYSNGPTFVTAASVHIFKEVYQRPAISGPILVELRINIIRFGRGKDACVFFLADWIGTLAYIDV